MANKYTMRKRKKLHQWKQEPWRYYAVAKRDMGVYEFLGTVWGWTRKEAKIKCARRYPNEPEIMLVGKGLMTAYLTHRIVVNKHAPKLIRDRKLMREVKAHERQLEWECSQGFIEDT